MTSSNKIPKQHEYDGIYFVPDSEEGKIKYEFFKLPEEYQSENKLNSSSIGDSWHIAFFSIGYDGLPELVDKFDAVFADPFTYLFSIKNVPEYGAVLRKTDKSEKWFDKWLHNVVISTFSKKLKNVVKKKLEK
jgi:hypothetical protein